MNLIRKLVDVVPVDAVKLSLEVNSVPNVIDRFGLYDYMVSKGVIFSGETKANGDFKGYFKGSFFRTYSSYVKACVAVREHYSAMGVETSLIDSKANGTYVSPRDR